ncbi:hypothetical protein D9M73_195250 [compost metagenome]
MRQHRNQGWRGCVVQQQLGITGDSITAQGEFDLLAVVHAKQQGIGRMAELLETAGTAPGRHTADRRRHLSRTLRGRWRLSLGLDAADGHEHKAGKQGFAKVAAHGALTSLVEREEGVAGIRGRKLTIQPSRRNGGRTRWRIQPGRYSYRRM